MMRPGTPSGIPPLKGNPEETVKGPADQVEKMERTARRREVLGKGPGIPVDRADLMRDVRIRGMQVGAFQAPTLPSTCTFAWIPPIQAPFSFR